MTGLFVNMSQHRHKSLTRSIIGRLMAEVGIVKLSIVTTLLHQGIVTTLFNSTAVAQHNNAVGITDGREAMSDDNGGTIFEQNIQTFLYLSLGERIDAGSGFIKDDNRGIFCNRTRASATSCRCPIESAFPSSPTNVCRRSGSASNQSPPPIRCAISATSSSLASKRA